MSNEELIMAFIKEYRMLDYHQYEHPDAFDLNIYYGELYNRGLRDTCIRIYNLLYNEGDDIYIKTYKLYSIMNRRRTEEILW